MRISAIGIVLMTVLAASAAAQNSTNLNRSEVAGVKAKLVALQKAMGGDPGGYVREEEDQFYLPTEFSPSQNGKYWPINASVSMQYTDRGVADSAANLEKLQEDIQTKYAAAMASGDPNRINQMFLEMTQLQMAAAGAAAAPPTHKEDMQIYVELNTSSNVAIDPDGVLLEQPGVMVLLNSRDTSGETGRVTVYLNPVDLASTTELAKIEFTTPVDGVAAKTGIYHAIIQLDGELADTESWIRNFDYPAMLAIFDPR